MITHRFVLWVCAIILAGVPVAHAVVDTTTRRIPSDTSAHVTLSRTQLNFGTVQSGGTATRSEQVQNTGKVPVVISAAFVEGNGFHFAGPDLPLTLAPGAAFSFRVVFTPPVGGDYTGRFRFQYKWHGARLHWSSRAIDVRGTAGREQGRISASLSQLQFGAVQVSGRKRITETLVNDGRTAVTISQIRVAGEGFTFSGINPPETLYPGQSISFPVGFAPSVSGESSGSLSIYSNASNSAISVALGGMGSIPGQLILNPVSINFGNVVVGSRQSQTVMLSVRGGPVTVSSANLNSSEFSISGISLPTTIATGSTVPITLNFTPQSSGSATGLLTVNTTGRSSNSTASIAGIGVPQLQYSVNLSWNASTSADIIGYNVYRGIQPGGPYSPITSAPETGTTETDNTVSVGQTYYYVVTAVSLNSQESVYSGEVRAVIPSP